MCAFYDDKQKIKKGDSAIYNGEKIEILSAKHIKENRTMDITYISNGSENIVNIPYKTVGYGFEKVER